MTTEHVVETASTNILLATRASEGAAEGSWVRADRQTAGKGRQGRRWESPTGNLYASGLVRLRRSDPPAPTLALATGVALWEAIRIYAGESADIALKWPNDILLGPAKLAGILLERHGDAVVVGVGVNLAFAPSIANRTTAALADIAAPPDPAAFCETLADAFVRELDIWRNPGLSETRRRWLVRGLPSGSPLRYHGEGGAAHDGLFDTLDDSGALVLRLADGSRMTVTAGDVDLLSEG